MAFKMGSPFSPEYLSLLQRERERKTSERSSIRNDLFRNAQLKAEVETGNARRRQAAQVENARLALAQAKDHTSRAIAQKELERAQMQMDLMSSREDRLRQGQEAGLEMEGERLGLAERKYRDEMAFNRERAPIEDALRGRQIGAQEDRTKVMSEAEQRRRYVEFGIDGQPSLTEEGLALGSGQSVRAANVEKTKEVSELTRKRIEELGKRIDGTLPPSLAEQARIGLAKRAQDIAIDAATMRSRQDARRLVADLFKAFKDPWDGTPPDRASITGIRDSIQKLASGMVQIAEDEGVDPDVIDELVDTYQDMMNEKIQEQNQKIRGEQRAGNAPSPGVSGSVLDQAQGLESRFAGEGK